MQIRVDKLRKNLILLQPVVPKKSALPVIKNVLVKDGSITATDLETTVSLNLPEAKEAAFLLPYRPVMELLKYVPGDEMLTIEDQEKILHLSWNGGSASYESELVKDYPHIPEKEARAEGSLNGDMLVNALVAALPYCSTDATRPVLSGVSLYLGTVLQIAGSDGFRLSYQALKLEYPLKETIIIPAGTVSVLENLWRKAPAQVGLETTLVRQLTAARQLKLSLWDHTIGVKFGNIALMSKLIEGTPPDHLQLLNNFKEPIKVKLMAPEFYNAVRRLQGVARDGTGIVRLQWTESKMTVSARSEEKGEVRADIPVESGSVPGRIAVNVNYLLDYLDGIDGLITIGKAEDSGPALFHYGNRPIVAIMPMSVQWGDEKPAKLGEQEASEESRPEGEEIPEDPVEPVDETPEGEGETREANPPEPEAAATATTTSEPEEAKEPEKPKRGRKKK